MCWICARKHMKQMCVYSQPADWCCPTFHCLDHIWFHFYIRIRLALFGDAVVVFVVIFCFFNKQTKKRQKKNMYALIRTVMREYAAHTHTYFFVFLSLVRLDVAHTYLAILLLSLANIVGSSMCAFSCSGGWCSFCYRIKFYSNTAQ